MSPSRPFILRPVATSLLMAAILLIGLVAYTQLPVSALPEVDYPTIQVVTFYPGASPDVMASAVTAPLERQLGEVPGLNQMMSTSSDGSSVIVLQFSLDLNIDVAEQEVQEAINAAGNYLPTGLPTPPIYSKTNPADTPILTLALTSSSVPLTQVEDLADTRLAQKISQLPGVGLVSISGGQKPAVRVQVNPTALSARGINLEDVRAALQQTSLDVAKGNFDGPQQDYQIQANDQLLTSADFKPVVVAYHNGAPVLLSDVARIVDEPENLRQAAWMNTVPAVIVNIQRQPGANIIQVADRIKSLLPQLQTTLPAAIQVAVLTDRTTTIRASVKDVEFELLLTIALVVMVIFLFLRNLSATIIPSVAVPLSLIGTFAVMYVAGYSLNNLTLMALTISTGFVVDDAIVMIENIVRYIEEGDEPLEAALKGSEQIGFTIVSLTISLIAVLIPLLFMGDIVGRLFREFAVTLSVTILVSAVVSLTLTPMMCSRLLRHKPAAAQGRMFHASERAFDAVIAFYGRTLRWVLQYQRDGTKFRSRPLTLPDSATVQVLLCGADHTLWIGTSDGLIRSRAGQDDRLTRADGLADNWVMTLMKGPDHAVFVGTKNGFSRIHGREIESFRRPVGGSCRRRSSSASLNIFRRSCSRTAKPRCSRSSPTGWGNKEIAERLGTASGTIKIHVQNILDKLAASDRTQAVTIALQRGILHLP